MSLWVKASENKNKSSKSKRFAPHLAQHGSYDGRAMAVQQALMIDGVMANQILHHQQEGGNAVSLQTALWKERGTQCHRLSNHGFTTTTRAGDSVSGSPLSLTNSDHSVWFC